MLAYRLLGDPDTMDDVLQEAYLKAYRAYPSFTHRAAPSTWLYRIVYNCCLDRLRALQRERGRTGAPASLDVLAEFGVEPVAPGDVSAHVEERDALGEALSALPPDQRAAVLLVDAMGHGYRSAAEVLGVRPGTVASRLSRARAALRDALTHTRPEEER